MVARLVWVSDDAKPRVVLQGTVEPKQRDEGASVSSDARRVCDASGAMNKVKVNKQIINIIEVWRNW